MQITIQTTVNADIDTVWAAWTTPDDINQWNAASDDWHNPRSSNDLRPGGQFCYRMEARDGSFGFDFEGTYTQVVPQQLIEYVLGDSRSVSIRFEPTEDGIQVSETFQAEDVHAAELQKQGWQSILNRFAAYVEAKNA
jgi:uncharacterized protein YndB with AHSA1/START domain